MMADAEKYAEEDKATAERIRSRNELENYAFNLKNQVNDAGGVGGKLDDDERRLQAPFTPSCEASQLT
jgi:heat shock protein 5